MEGAHGVAESRTAMHVELRCLRGLLWSDCCVEPHVQLTKLPF